MASKQDFVDYILDQIEDAGQISARKMFGEYGIYSDGKIFALICDNNLLKNKLDKLILMFRDSNPVFYDGYQRARTIVD